MKNNDINDYKKKLLSYFEHQFNYHKKCLDIAEKYNSPIQRKIHNAILNELNYIYKKIVDGEIDDFTII